MRDVGFVIDGKENERRRALSPDHVARVGHADRLIFESGYGEVLGAKDADYIAAGARSVSREDAWGCEIVCSVKAPTVADGSLLGHGQTLFGWLHLVQNHDITDLLVDRDMTGIAWEEMVAADGYVFRGNRDLTGEAGILHALLCLGKAAGGLEAAVVGYGKVGQAAARTLRALGARVTAFDIDDEQRFRREFPRFDLIVISVLWDVSRSDRLLYRDDLARLKKGAAIIDLSCDHGLEVETSWPTTIADPLRVVDGVPHYAVDHVPALVWHSATDVIGEALIPYIDVLVEGHEDENAVLDAATVVRRGAIVDRRIAEFQGR
jgi:N5-(carboxyethyl)ornithine synthase